MLTAREHLATAYVHLCAALAATAEPEYQSGVGDPVPIGALKRCIDLLETYSVVPRDRSYDFSPHKEPPK